uniref:Putative secreted peptide n=1 Tax=Anopheles braziliensis TaxID=58242 RepID=A0A2M3ZXM1_9DIPT
MIDSPPFLLNVLVLPMLASTSLRRAIASWSRWPLAQVFRLPHAVDHALKSPATSSGRRRSSTSTIASSMPLNCPSDHRGGA